MVKIFLFNGLEIFTLLLTLQNESTGREEIETTCKIPYLLLNGLACRVIRKNSLGPWHVTLLRAAKMNKHDIRRGTVTYPTNTLLFKMDI